MVTFVDGLDTYRWTDADGVARTLRVTGHNMLVRKCRRDAGEFLVGGETRAVRGLPPYLLQRADEYLLTLTERTNWCEVLAVGPLCNTSAGFRERRKKKMPCIYNPCKPGDFVVLPEVSKHQRMWNGVTGNLFDLIVDECELLLLVKQEDV